MGTLAVGHHLWRNPRPNPTQPPLRSSNALPPPPPSINPLEGGGGSIKPPKTAGGSGEGAHQLKALKICLCRGSMVFFFFALKTRQMMAVLEPRAALIPKMLFSMLYKFGIQMTSTPRGWSQLSPFGGMRGGSAQGTLWTPSSTLKTCPSLSWGGPRGSLKRSARVVQLFGRLAVLETHILRYQGPLGASW